MYARVRPPSSARVVDVRVHGGLVHASAPRRLSRAELLVPRLELVQRDLASQVVLLHPLAVKRGVLHALFDVARPHPSVVLGLHGEVPGRGGETELRVVVGVRRVSGFLLLLFLLLY